MISRRFPSLSLPLLFLLGVLVATALFWLVRNPAFLDGVNSIQAVTHPNFRVDGDILRNTITLLQGMALSTAVLCHALILHHALQTDGVRRSPRAQALLSWLLHNPAALFSVFLVLIAANLTLRNSVIIEGTRYFFLRDDAMISMRYARNFADGLGLVWNPGYAVEGYTNFLWVMVMAVFHFIGVPESHTSLAVLVVVWAMAVGILWLLQAVLKRLDVNLVWIYAALLVFTIDQNVLYWGASGLEGMLVAFLVAVCVWAIITRRLVWFVVSLSLMPLARNDSALLAVTLGLLFIYDNRDRWKTAVVAVGLSTLPTVAFVVFRVLYYGDLLPNTYYQKLSPQIDGLWQIGIGYIYRLLDGYTLFVALTVLAIFVANVDRRVRVFALIWILQIAYVVRVGGDSFKYLRFVLPVLPLMYVAVPVTLNALLRDRAAKTSALVAVAALVIAAAPLSVSSNRILLADDIGLERDWVRVGLIVERNAEPGTLLTISAAGTIPYFAERQDFLDVLGLNDLHIAHVEPPTQNTWIGHNKFDYDYVYDERQPDITTMSANCNITDDIANAPVPTEEFSERAVRTDWRPIEAHHPTYLERYQPNYLSTYNEDGILDPFSSTCFFARDDSPVRRTWTVSGEPLTEVSLGFQFVYMSGEGWDIQRTDPPTGTTFRRMAATESTIYFPLAPDRAYQVAYRVVAPEAELAGMGLRVNGQEIALEREDEGDNRYVYSGNIPEGVITGGDALFTFRADAPGIAFDRIRVVAVE